MVFSSEAITANCAWRAALRNNSQNRNRNRSKGINAYLRDGECRCCLLKLLEIVCCSSLGALGVFVLVSLIQSSNPWIAPRTKRGHQKWASGCFLPFQLDTYFPQWKPSIAHLQCVLYSLEQFPLPPEFPLRPGLDCWNWACGPRWIWLLKERKEEKRLGITPSSLIHCPLVVRTQPVTPSSSTPMGTLEKLSNGAFLLTWALISPKTKKKSKSRNRCFMLQK